MFGGDNGALDVADRELDAVEANLALARGRIVHARFIAERHEDPRELEFFERAATLYERLGDARGQADALFWVGTFHQVVRADNAAALPALQRAHGLAERVGDKLILSYVERHLGFADMSAGRTDAARELFEESLRLRREIRFLPGVAAALLTLAELAAETGDRDAAVRLLDEARTVAVDSDAAGILRWIDAAHAELERR